MLGLDLAGVDPRSERPSYLFRGHDLSSWNLREADVPLFTLFLAIDGNHYANEEVTSLAGRMGDAGIGYCCVWGPRCGSVHGLFDLETVDAEARGAQRSDLLTTSHAEESLAVLSGSACAPRHGAGILAGMSQERSVDWIREQLRRAGFEDAYAPGGRTLASEPLLLCASAGRLGWGRREIYSADGALLAWGHAPSRAPDSRAVWRTLQTEVDVIDFVDGEGQALLRVKGGHVLAPDGSPRATVARHGFKKGLIKAHGVNLGRLKRSGTLGGFFTNPLHPRYEVVDQSGAVVCRIASGRANIFEFPEGAPAELRELVPALDDAIEAWETTSDGGGG